jgi:predicted nucleic acid-binding protein
MDFLWNSRTGRTSFQVLHEFYVTVTEKLKPGLLPKRARKDIQALFAWRPVTVDQRVVEDAWGIQYRYKLSRWDSLILSAALISKCRYLFADEFSGAPSPRPSSTAGGLSARTETIRLRCTSS